MRAPLRLLATALIAAATATAENSIQRAIELARAKKYAEAAAALEGVGEPEAAPQRIAFHRLKAAIASGLGEHERAVREMRAALRLAPSDAGLRRATAVAETAFAEAEERRGNYVSAARAFQSAVELAPEEEQYRLNLALELAQHQTFEPAITVLEQAAPVFPKSARIRTLLAVAYYAVARTEDAVRSLSAALAIEPGFEPAREYLARIVLDASSPPEEAAVNSLCVRRDAVCAAARLRRDRNSGAAFADLQAAARREPESAVARCELGRALEWREQWAEARTEMEACVRLDPSPQNHYRLARVYKRLGQEDLAEREIAAQKKAARRAQEEVERRERAVEAFQYVIGR
jgi:tetratricopeptide (TPR) repeat protein